MELSGPACLLLGASSQLGECILPRLLAADYTVHAVSRKPHSAVNSQLSSATNSTASNAIDRTAQRVHWHQLDLQSPVVWPAKVSLVVHLAPLYTLPALLQQATEPLRVIAISSTSVRSKYNSPAAAERALAQRLLRAELELSQLCQARGHSLTILRPTMLYGVGRDATIGRMQRFVQRWGFLPLPSMPTGLRQPVHVDDVAKAIIQVINEPNAFHKVYELGGGDCLTVQQLAQRIFIDNHQPVRIVAIPTGLLAVVFALLKVLRPQLDWSPALLKRAAADQLAENQAAQQDFQYAPRPFNGVFPACSLNQHN